MHVRCEPGREHAAREPCQADRERARGAEAVRREAAREDAERVRRAEGGEEPTRERLAAEVAGERGQDAGAHEVVRGAQRNGEEEPQQHGGRMLDADAFVTPRTIYRHAANLPT